MSRSREERKELSEREKQTRAASIILKRDEHKFVTMIIIVCVFRMKTFLVCARSDRFRSFPFLFLPRFGRSSSSSLSLSLSLSLSRRVPLLLFFHEARRERLFPFHVSLLLAKFVLVFVVRLVQISIVRESPDGKLRFQTGRPVVAQILSLRKRQRRARAFVPVDLEN